MIDIDGRQVSEKDFLGHPLLAIFGYTHCQSVCPAQVLTVSKALQEMGYDAQIRAIFVTVDPEHDSASALHDFLAKFDPRIIGLRGDQAALSEMMRAFRVSAIKMGLIANDYWIDHDTAIFLMDKKGRFVKIIDGSRKPQDIASELKPYL
jgi:protein SCO1/2